MIQRIQTIFLLLTAILMAVVLYFPICEVIDNDGISVMFHSYGIGEISGDTKPAWEGDVFTIAWGALTFTVLSIITPFAAIFLYKNRKRQARLTLLNVLFIIMYYVAVISYLVSFVNKIDRDDFNININMDVTSFIIFLLPFIALIFDLLAYRRIRKDEKLVKSLDRIR